MTLSEWLKNNFVHVTLSEQVGTLIVKKYNVDLTIGLISTNNKEEFAKLAFTYVPVGTIIDTIDDEWYETKLLQVRNLLTSMTLLNGSNKFADRLLEILSRRDKEHWSKEGKQVKVEQKEDKTLNITFDIV